MNKNNQVETKLLTQIKEVLSTFSGYWEGDVLLRNKVIEDLRSYEEKLIEALLANELIKETYSITFASTTVFKIEDFISMLRYKNYWEDSYTKYSNEIGLTSEGKYLSYNTDVVLDFPHKDGVLEGGMTKEDEGKKEIYYHNVLAKAEIDTLSSPKVLNNIKKHNKNGVHNITEFKNNDNLIIKGNNLIALHTLKEKYDGNIKFIYIDPPYNTGNDEFKYNDKYNRSTWLTFMRNRLKEAYSLLATDGWLTIHIDDNEQSHLKVLCDEIFGEENFVNNIAIRDSHASGLKLAHKEKTIIKTKSYMLVYRKTSHSRINPCYVERDEWDTHFNRIIIEDENGLRLERLSDRFKEEYNKPDFRVDGSALKDKDFNEFIDKYKNSIVQSTKEIPTEVRKESLEKKDNVVTYFNSSGEKSYAFNGRRLSSLTRSFWDISIGETPNKKFAKLLCDFWEHIDFNNLQNEGGVSLPTGKKPEKLLGTLIKMFTKREDIVLDFFMGSGTTQAVAHKMNRQYIGVEQMDYINDISVNRLQNVIEGEQGGISEDVEWQGGGSFVYAELQSLNDIYIKDIQNIENEDELNNVLKKMKDSAYLNFKVDLERVTSEDQAYEALKLEEKKKVLIQILDMNQLYLNFSEIEDTQYDISESVKQFNYSFYQKESDEK